MSRRLNRIAVAAPLPNQNFSASPSNVLVYSVGGKNFAYFKTSERSVGAFSCG